MTQTLIQATTQRNTHKCLSNAFSTFQSNPAIHIQLPFSPQHTPAATHWSRATVTHCHFHLLPVAIGGLSKLHQELNFRWIECLCVVKDTRSQFVHSSSSRVLQRAPRQDSTCTAGSCRSPGPQQAGSWGRQQHTHTSRFALQKNTPSMTKSINSLVTMLKMCKSSVMLQISDTRWSSSQLWHKSYWCIVAVRSILKLNVKLKSDVCIVSTQWYIQYWFIDSQFPYFPSHTFDCADSQLLTSSVLPHALKGLHTCLHT